MAKAEKETENRGPRKSSGFWGGGMCDERDIKQALKISLRFCPQTPRADRKIIVHTEISYVLSDFGEESGERIWRNL
ncbi:MAG: hypothetical protein FWD39_04185 [Clostridiales bacterium]|nr:hypothetical protein [Clostridiales bacterium]